MGLGTHTNGQYDQRNRERFVGRIDLGNLAGENYKVRLTRGLLEVGLSEGYIVEIINYRTKKVLRRELFDDIKFAREETARIKADIETLTTEEFRNRYLKVR